MAECIGQPVSERPILTSGLGRKRLHRKSAFPAFRGVNVGVKHSPRRNGRITYSNNGLCLDWGRINVGCLSIFCRMVRARDAAALDDWLITARSTAFGFANGLISDIAAVRGALSQPWSNGPVEGQVNRLKLMKRQMYGRANFDLLRSRVLHVA